MASHTLSTSPTTLLRRLEPGADRIPAAHLEEPAVENSHDPRVLDDDNTGGSTGPATPKKDEDPSAPHSTLFNGVSGSDIDDDVEARWIPMAIDLAHRSYISPTMWDTFLEGIPVVAQEQIDEVRKQPALEKFIASCATHQSSGSNEEEFKDLIQSIAGLEGLGKYFRDWQGKSQEELEIANPRRGRVRISHQGHVTMETWNEKAKWLTGNSTRTTRRNKLKPDLMSIIVDDVEEDRPREAQPKRVQLAKLPTILPPPDDWTPPQMNDHSFPIVECTRPVWECLDLFWECHRNSQALNNATVYLDCALKAAEALRYQWSRRFIYCFLHCGATMQLLQFDRSGLMASEKLDLVTNTDIFVRCLLGVFCHRPSRLGYPAGREAPFHRRCSDDGLLQVVTVGGRQLYIRDQKAGPLRDHLVGRATVVFKAKLVDPQGEEKRGWDWCYKSSWPQKKRKHEGEFLLHLRELSCVVELLAYGVKKVEEKDDDTDVGRQCRSGQSMALLDNFFDRARKYGLDSALRNDSTSETATSGHEDLGTIPLDPKRPPGESRQECDIREHRDVVIAWVNRSFNEVISSLSKSPEISKIWQQAFSAIKSICEKGILHRDISSRNIRIDDQLQVKVCDFDMASSIADLPSDRTGTIAFMATSMLSSEPRVHRPVHDCESIFWLCALNLLGRIGIGETRETLAQIVDPGMDTTTVRIAKDVIIFSLGEYREMKKSKVLKSLFSLDDPKDSSLFFCLTALAKELWDNGFHVNYEGAEEGFESACFDRCIEIIKGELDPPVQQAMEGIAKISLSH